MIAYILTALAFSAVNAQSPLLETKNVNQPKSLAADYQLPSNIVPSFYQLEVEPDFDSDTYNGSVSITISVVSTTNTVVFHTYELELDISRISLLDDSGSVVNSVAETSYSDDDRHFYSIVFEDDLAEGAEYVLVIGSFSGILNDENLGFYLAKYTDEEGEERKLATTKFEPTSARRAFPCFDEPDLKAEFEVTVIRSNDYYAISNTPLESTTEISDGRFQDKFERTVRMSTYLVAFIVSDFLYVADENQRVFARPAAIESGGGDFPLATGIAALKALEEYVNVPYSLSKMDQVGLPDEYFTAGAMENWGLVTYRESYLIFYDETLATEIIAHEFAHQWFGNLVSPAWWTYLWLNEGFATYFEHYASALVYQDYDYLYRVVTRSVQYALTRESRMTSRPMNEEVGSPTDIRALFDVISYDKAGSVIRMAAGILSEDVFRSGLNIYLNNRQFDSAVPADLYSAWQQALDESDLSIFPEGEDVASVMTTWDSNAGYPLVTVTRNSDNSVTLSQRLFLTDDPYNDDESLWYVPITYTTASNPNFVDHSPRFWLTERSATVELDDLGDDDWLVVNLQTIGYYRVNYDEDSWYRIIDALNEDIESIDRINRAQLYDDSYELAFAEVIDYDIAFDLSEYATRETDYFPVQSFIKAINFLDGYLVNTEIYEKFRLFVVNKLEAVLEDIPIEEKESERHFAKLNRINVQSTLCRYESSSCKSLVDRRLTEWQSVGKKLSFTKLEAPLVCGAFRFWKPHDLDVVFQRYSEENNAMVRKELLNVLSCTQHKETFNRLLDIILDKDNNMKANERMELLSSAYDSGNFATTQIFNYVAFNWTKIYGMFTETQLSSLMKEMAERLSTKEQLDELKSLSEKVDASAVFEEALRAVQKNIDWVKRRVPSISAWLNKRY